MASDADDAPLVKQEFLDHEALTNFRAGFGGRVDEQLVQHNPSWAIRDRRFLRAWCPGDRERTEVKGVSVNRRAPRRDKAIEHAPSRQGGRCQQQHAARSLRAEELLQRPHDHPG